MTCISLVISHLKVEYMYIFHVTYNARARAALVESVNTLTHVRSMKKSVEKRSKQFEICDIPYATSSYGSMDVNIPILLYKS